MTAATPRDVEPVSLLWSWRTGDALPPLPPGTEPVVEEAGLGALSAFAGPSGAEDARLRAAGNRPYVARLDGHIVAFGWSAHETASLGPPGTTFRLPPDSRYLWGFATVPRWRGRGVYPRLLQAILGRETGGAHEFWIAHRIDNAASARGIEKAGFHHAGQIVRLPDGRCALAPHGPTPTEREQSGARVLAIPLLADD